MDTSEEYIKMCNCPEIQDKWKLEEGQVYYVDRMENIYLESDANNPIWKNCFERFGSIPSKEDLQRFIKDDGRNCPKRYDSWMYLHDKEQAERIKDWKFYQIRILAGPTRDDEYKTWERVHKIRKKKFYVYGLRIHGSFKALIENVNYFYIWLPRQDELQNMLSYQIIAKIRKLCELFNTNLIDSVERCWLKIAKIRKFCESFNTNLIDSMEQCWLKFVMFELYKLSWNGKEWKKFI